MWRGIVPYFRVQRYCTLWCIILALRFALWAALRIALWIALWGGLGLNHLTGQNSRGNRGKMISACRLISVSSAWLCNQSLGIHKLVERIENCPARQPCLFHQRLRLRKGVSVAAPVDHVEQRVEQRYRAAGQ